jgi:hypothetical protein
MTLPGRQVRQPRWAGLAWALWMLTLSGLAAAFWLDQLLRRAGRSELALRVHELVYVVAWSAWRRSGRCWPAAGRVTPSAG